MPAILDNIIEVLLDTKQPILAKEIEDRLKSKGIRRPLKKNETITLDQIYGAIRDDRGKLIETILGRPNTYRLIQQSNNLWALKTVKIDDRASQTVDHYDDNLSEHYNYDSLVANSKQITEGDQAILIDKKKILGFATIGYIETTEGKKTVRRCPKCPSTTIDKRKTKKPTYRCNKGHEFETPLKEIKSVTKYCAKFKLFTPIAKLSIDLKQLRPFYTNGYNQNMSMQRLDHGVLGLFENVEKELSTKDYKYISLHPDQGYNKEDEEPYQANNKDEREIALRAIKLRRGQQDFRKKLLERYDKTCVITGCKIIDILEAAHIRPYRGKNDNNPSNGLLLRADIHTLFDLNLVAIEPDSHLVHFHSKVIGDYKQFHLTQIKTSNGDLINYDSLLWRWKLFF